MTYPYDRHVEAFHALSLFCGEPMVDSLDQTVYEGLYGGVPENACHNEEFSEVENAHILFYFQSNHL